MNIINWNVRGLGRQAKRYIVKDFLDLHKGGIVYIQELKLSMVDLVVWRGIGSSNLHRLCFALAKVSSGG